MVVGTSARRKASRRRAGVAICILLLVALLPVGTAHATSITRYYEASSTIVRGNATNYVFTGTITCNNVQDTLADTGACIALDYGPHNLRGHDFTVTVRDDTFDNTTWFVVGLDTNGDKVVRCTGGNGPDLCWLAQDQVNGTIPAGTSADVIRVFPATLHTSGFPCCPTTGATEGRIVVAFT